MSLPVPNLDDRRFQDIVDEAKRMIPRFCPEWTNHNLSDPGVALVELFAWMTELTLYRLNQVPDRQFTQFLNLVGIAPFPARPASVPLTFWLSAVPEEPVLVPAGTEVATAEGADGGVVFATVDDLRIDQPALAAALTGNGEDNLRDVLPELRYDRDAVACFPSQPVRPEDAFYLGFDRSLAGQVIELSFDTAASGVGLDPQRPPIRWEAWTGEFWVPATVHSDDTGGLNRDGTVVLMVPRLHEPLTLANQRRWWLRVRLVEAAADQPTYATTPLVRNVRAACLGGTVRAEHSELVVDEVLGRATGEAGMTFSLAHAPVLPRRDDEFVLVAGGGTGTDGVARLWREVPDFSASGPDDTHVVWDDAAGVIRFGPAVRYPDGTVRHHGAVPPSGATISVARYRHGGGSAGNVGAGTLTMMRVGIPFVDRVENLAPARGGVDPEAVDNVKERGPLTLRAGERAVTAGDFERLALESTTEVARARCLPATRPGEPVRVLLVPRLAAPPDLHTIDDFALDDRLYQTVQRYLDERRVIGSVVELTAPYYVGLSVVTMVRAATGRPPTLVRQRVLDALYAHLSPVPSPDGSHAGWAWGAPVTSAGLTNLVAELDGVAGVDELVCFEVDLRSGQRLGDPIDLLSLDERTLPLGAKHRVVVR